MQGDMIRVLIVGDTSPGDDRLDDALTAAGLQSRSATDGPSGIGILDAWSPSVVVVDLRPPSADAHRFCADLAERPNAGGPPVVLVGGGTHLLKRTPVIPDGLVPTPVDADHFVATVVRLAREDRGVRGEPIALR